MVHPVESFGQAGQGNLQREAFFLSVSQVGEAVQYLA